VNPEIIIHENFMLRAIELALKVPQYPFGAIIVNRPTGEIIAEGFNQSTLNPTFHGEMVAINRCAELHHPLDWSEFDLYTTAEPCSMCQSAIQWAGISRIFYGTSIPYLQQLNWWQINIRASEVIAKTSFRNNSLIGGILEEECNAPFDNAPKGIFNLK
jgi:tRNA(Arg) A34 adenosine deaminase TadA